MNRTYLVKKNDLYYSKCVSGVIVWSPEIAWAHPLDIHDAMQVANTWGAEMIKVIEDYEAAYNEANNKLEKIKSLLSGPPNLDTWEQRNEVLNILAS
jgi:hypothetical protein